MGDQYQSRYHCQEGAPSESGRACKSEGVSGQAGGLSCSETSQEESSSHSVSLVGPGALDVLAGFRQRRTSLHRL